ncbi:MAG: FmdB family zinc ribbon protein [Cyanophyceae cyanobacterium]
MPLYEYRCHACGEFEAWRPLADCHTLMHCPTCEVVAQKIFSPPNVNLNSGRVNPPATQEPRRIQRQELTSPRYQSARGGRPWMISH